MKVDHKQSVYNHWNQWVYCQFHYHIRQASQQTRKGTSSYLWLGLFQLVAGGSGSLLCLGCALACKLTGFVGRLLCLGLSGFASRAEVALRNTHSGAKLRLCRVGVGLLLGRGFSLGGVHV